MTLTLVFILLAGILMLIGVLLAWSYPGTPQPYLDENGKPLANSISEKSWVEINGVRQGMFIKGKNIDNPVLLFVHGGPGMPEYWLTATYPTGLEENFTLVWWEQRGAGLSFSSNIPAQTMTSEQLVADTLAVTQYLRQRFHQDKIYLLAHSWGSYIGIQAAAQQPELYHAYIGMAQVSHQIQSEQLAYQYALEYYQKIGDTNMLKRLQAAPPSQSAPMPAAYRSLRDEYMHKAGIGTAHTMNSVVTGIFLPSWQFREYTLSEKINLWRGKIQSGSTALGLWDKMQMDNLFEQVPELKIPVYLLEGRHDYTCAYSLAKEYFEQLKAPLKGFYTFENSAHSPIFEEPEKARQIFKEDILAGKTDLSD